MGDDVGAASFSSDSTLKPETDFRGLFVVIKIQDVAKSPSHFGFCRNYGMV
jgi:hypothetical protein